MKTRMNPRALVSAMVTAAVLSVAPALAQTPAKKPNILVIMGDDIGVKLGDRTYKNHLDGYDQTAAITGKGPSARHEIFYLGESTVGAVRIDDYKYRFIVLDYPPMQRGASFNLDAVKAEMAKRMAEAQAAAKGPSN